IRGPSDFHYKLSCRVGQKTYTIDDLRQQSVYIGADRDALSWEIESETPATRSARLPAAPSSDSTAGRAVGLLSNASPCRLPTLELRSGESLHVSVIAISEHE